MPMFNTLYRLSVTIINITLDGGLPLYRIMPVFQFGLGGAISFNFKKNNFFYAFL
jgi:hypothetical protein